jgi:7-cyano-7-deazaguanine synthase in queuosine biosynthesis
MKAFHRQQTPEYNWTASRNVDPERTTYSLGNRQISMRTIDIPHTGQECDDAGAFALAAVSMSCNAEITFDYPISRGCADKLQKLASTYRMWSIPSLAPLRLNTPIIYDDLSTSHKSGILCLSGGLDSTHAAICAKENNDDITGALLIAGADYENTESAGFSELSQSVQKIADRFELNLHIAETTIFFHGFNWDQLHGFNLAACLNLFSNQYGFGAYAQDFTLAQSLYVHPWGNNQALSELFSTTNFPTKTYGTEATRIQKLGKVLEFDEKIVANMSVCYEDRSLGGNCGKCRKCLQLRANLEANNAANIATFADSAPIAKSVRQLEVPESISGIKTIMAFTTDLVDALPDNETRAAFADYENRLREKLAFLS